MYIHPLRRVLGLPVHWEIYSWLWAGWAEDCHGAIRDGHLIIPVAKSTVHPVLEVSPLSGSPQKLLIPILHICIRYVYRKKMEAHRNTIWGHFACHHLQLWIILLSGGLAFKVISQKVIQHCMCEDRFNLLEGCRKEPGLEELSIFLSPIGTNTEHYFHVKYTTPINYSEQRVSGVGCADSGCINVVILHSTICNRK